MGDESVGCLDRAAGVVDECDLDRLPALAELRALVIRKQLSTLAERGRPELLSDLGAAACVIGRLGGLEALRATLEAIDDAQRWWP